MQKTFLTLYAFFGPMLFSFCIFGLAGKYEEAFLDEVRRGCPRLLCEVTNHGGREYDKYYTHTEKVGDSVYYSSIGTISKPHYKTTSGSYKQREPDNFRCSRCYREGFSHKSHFLNYPKINIHSYNNCVTIEIDAKEYTRPCASFYISFYPKDPLDVILKQYGNRHTYPYNYYSIDYWTTTLEELWLIAINLDLKDAGIPERMKLGLEPEDILTDEQEWLLERWKSSRVVKEKNNCVVQ